MDLPSLASRLVHGLVVAESGNLPIVLTLHARRRLRERGTTEKAVILAVRIGLREPAQRGLFLHRLDVPFGGTWRGRRYDCVQIAAVVAHEPGQLVVVTVYTFFVPPLESAP